MPNGKKHDNPVSDTIVHGLHPFPPDIEDLVRQVHARNPGVFNDLMWAPFHWERGERLDEARNLLKGLIAHHGDVMACRKILNEYQTSQDSDSSTR